MKTSGIKQATTGLAGAIALAGGTQAYGAVVSATPPANYVPTSGVSSFNEAWDVNGDGTADFSLGFTQASTNGNWFAGIYGYGGVGTNAPVGYVNAFAGTSGTIYLAYVSRLSIGSTIGSSSTFVQTDPYASILGSRYGSKFYGQFVNHTGGTAITGWIGFEFTEADGIHYGALEVTTSRYRTAANPGGLTFLAAEYQTVAGVPLVISAVPEPTSLAALAFGGAGVAAAVAARRKRAGALV